MRSMPPGSDLEHNQDSGQRHVAGNSRRVLSDLPANGDHGAILKNNNLATSSEESLGPRSARYEEGQDASVPSPGGQHRLSRSHFHLSHLQSLHSILHHS